MIRKPKFNKPTFVSHIEPNGGLLSTPIGPNSGRQDYKPVSRKNGVTEDGAVRGVDVQCDNYLQHTGFIKHNTQRHLQFKTLVLLD